MEIGGGINPRNLRPVDEFLEKETKEREAKRKLEEKAAFFQDSANIIRVIEERLQRRIEGLVEQDPEAASYMRLLTDLGHKFNASKTAIEVLHKRYFGDVM